MAKKKKIFPKNVEVFIYWPRKYLQNKVKCNGEINERHKLAEIPPLRRADSTTCRLTNFQMRSYNNHLRFRHSSMTTHGITKPWNKANVILKSFIQPLSKKPVWRMEDFYFLSIFTNLIVAPRARFKLKMTPSKVIFDLNIHELTLYMQSYCRD